jgi:hypothetical protein
MLVIYRGILSFADLRELSKESDISNRQYLIKVIGETMETFFVTKEDYESFRSGLSTSDRGTYWFEMGY